MLWEIRVCQCALCLPFVGIPFSGKKAEVKVPAELTETDT